jgi:hypothetical protein
LLAAKVQAGATRQVAAAVAAAMWRLATGGLQMPPAEVEEALVEDRLQLLKPVLLAQTRFAMKTGG